MSAPEAPTFELRAPLLTDSLAADGPGTALPVLGLWSAAPAAPREAVSFGLPGVSSAVPPPEGPVWRVNLPADPRQAHAHLSSGVQHIRAAQRALPGIEQRMAALASEQATRQQGGISFALAPAAPLPAPERELLAELAYLAGRGDPEEISFGLPGIALPNRAQVQQGMAQVRHFLRHVLSVVANYAWVETRQHNLLVGRTAVGWTGDAETVWPQPCRAEHVHLHWNTLDLALQSRTTLIRTMIIVTHGAVKLSTLLAMPGGVVLALPAVWKCINRLMDEYR
jgi:hypothetical protein